MRTNYLITARSNDIAVAGIVAFRNQKYEGSLIGFTSENFHGSKILTLIRSNPVGENLNEYYLFLKTNEIGIMAAVKNIRKL